MSAKQLVTNAAIRSGLSASAFNEIEKKFSLQLKPAQRALIQKQMRLVAGQSPWDDAGFVRGRIRAAARVVTKLRQIEKIMDDKILYYRDKKVNWDKCETRFSKNVREMRGYFTDEIRALSGSAGNNKERRGAKRKERERDLLSLLFPIYKAAGGKQIGVWRKRQDGVQRRQGQFVDFVRALCARAGFELKITHSLWEEFRFENKRRRATKG